MSITVPSNNVVASSIPSSNPVRPQGGNDVLVGGTGGLASARWQDKDGNGKIDIEVDMGDEEGEHFSGLGMTGYNAPNEAQQRELRQQMGLMTNDVNVTFHKKGEIANPDGKIKIGSFPQNTTQNSDVVSYTPTDSSKPVEVYFNGNEEENPTISLPDGYNKGGNTLTRALLYAMGVTPPKPVEEGGTRDSLGYSALSPQSETTTGHDFKGKPVTSPQIDDKGQLEKLFGGNTSVKDKTFELHELGKDGWGATLSISSGVAGHETLDASADTNDQVINLKPGKFSSVKGYKDNVSITTGTVVEDVKTGSGTNRIYPNAGANTITLGTGENTVVYEQEWDGSPARQDKIIGFKTGVDKLDVSNLWTYPPYMRFEVETNADGSTWVKGWSGADKSGPVPDKAPDFLLRADGAQRSDLILNAIGI